MPRFTEHEFLDLQEHIRGEAATAETCRQFAKEVTDPDLRSFCDSQAQQAEQNCQRLITFVQQRTH